jgi:prepilin-type N-terminal cleavage/methylation domain-containing protein
MRLRPAIGFTLPELLMTAAILSYSLSVVLATYTNSIALNETSRNLTTAVSHGQVILENIRNATFSGVATSISGGTWNWNTATVTSNGLTALNGESIAVSSSGTNPLDITVTVSWNDLNNRSRTRVLQTTISG